ncbi:hypothetical protein GALMADRAFT_145261 [Galerina marginata CBS 339.88]|uniref:GED domain-containing protein n=1 Tax=Galerina marginata (strain CBS 339.88) TaxID=685588 RepID=A0A067SIR1_GALM3|nr:hypothetical protein GALMADRAFT_145261 [Galerina marginata CBS 339.88]
MANDQNDKTLQWTDTGLEMSKRSRRELDMMNALHDTGVQSDIDLPQIIVSGMQSSGKSSLIEAISGTSLPRAPGTCTRCPTECRLSRSDSPWQCIVSLRFLTDASGRPLGQSRNQRFGKVIYNKAEVEDRVRRAQLAILNPNKPLDFFLNEDGDSDAGQDGPQLTFSTNCVTLEISGPNVPDLSFCDLPGLIANISSSQGSSNDIALVEDLVTSYIKKPSCIILLAVACETDFENQGAHRLAKLYDPEGERTVGVLTKPDRIPDGEEQRWIQFIRNEKEPLKNNWFCVKQPNSKELESKITWAKARENENVFFSKAPWSELEPMYQKCLTTGKLVERLSIILSDLISKRIPIIQEALQKSMTDTRHLLSQLPRAPTSDPHSEILTLIYNFASDLAHHVEGVPDDAEFGSGRGLIQTIRPVQDSFRIKIRRTAPDFQPFEKKDSSTKRLQVAEFLKAEEGDEFEKQTMDEQDLRIYIDEVLERADSARTRELPGHYPFIVQRTFIEHFVTKWRDPAIELCESAYTIVSDHVDNLMNKHFGEFGQGHLERRISAIVHQHIKQCLEYTEDRVQWLLRMENLPFSLNTHYLADYRSKFLSYFKGARQKYEQSSLMREIEQYTPTQPAPLFSRNAVTVQPTGIAKVLAALAEIGISGIKAEDLPKLLPPDRMEPALGIMADVRAYFQVAYKRFADNVPLAIDLELVRGVEQDLLPILFSGLGINGPEGDKICKDFAQESPQVADRRTDLLKKLERLENAHRELLFPGL